jgi:alkaline phosphatase D
MSPSPMDRRTFLTRAAAVGAGVVVTGAAGAGTAAAAPALLRAGRPVLTHGVQAGDVSARGAVVWARADRPSRMVVEVARSAAFRDVERVRGGVLTPDSDLTGKVVLRDLDEGRDVHYRVVLEDLDDRSLTSEPVAGTFRTAPDDRRDVSFVWSGDCAGQGWGINPDFGGYRLFEAMRRTGPDFAVHSGDTVYADGPIKATQADPASPGGIWRNVVTPQVSKVAESLDEFRGRYRYNLTDANLLRFNREVPWINQWDDHETLNNWYPGEILDLPQYTEKRVDVLAARASQAFHEYQPITTAPDEIGRVYRQISYGPLLDVFVLDMRTYRGPNSPDAQPTASAATAFLGQRQVDWLLRGLRRSKATWKVIASDMPLGLVVPDGPVDFEAVAQGLAGGPLGRELEIAQVLSGIKAARVERVVWLTADVHYTAAHHYSPERAAFTDFTPFWEFVAGPMNAGAFGPNKLDPTFGPEAVFVKAPPAPNASPASGYQFFGHVAISGASRALTVTLRDIEGTILHTQVLTP